MNQRLFSRSALALCLMLLACLPGIGRAAAQAAPDSVILDKISGRYRIVATANPFPLEVGTADISITITDAASGAPVPVPAVNVITQAYEIGHEQLYIAPPINNDRTSGDYKTERLYFSTSGTWQVRIQLIADSEVQEFATTVEVTPVLDRIKKAAVVAVPATLAALLAVALAWRWWRRRAVARESD